MGILPKSLNKCVKYVSGLMALHRTAFSSLRCAKSAVYAGVMGQNGRCTIEVREGLPEPPNKDVCLHTKH